MRSNSSLSPLFFHFTLFADHGPLRYLFFCLCLMTYVTIISANAVIFLTVCLEKSLHQPMYIFICFLSLNSLCGSAAFFPRFLVDVLSDSHFISRMSCFIQMYIIHSYKGQEITVLTVMAYDRFVAILHPLHYHSRMTLKMVRHLLIFALFSPVCVFSFFFYLSSRLPLCGNKVHRLFCTIWSVVQLSCVDTTTEDIARQVLVVLYIVVPLFFVLYTYLRILLVCRRSSTEFRGKTLQTCLPHIITFLNFCISILCEVSLYTVDEVNTFAIVFLSMEFLIVPPITNPLVYGLNLPQIRGVIFRRVKICKIALAAKPKVQQAQSSDCHTTSY
nr:PREDICTED: olfactory receptor 6N1-like [Paralichthys olivaceus]